MYSKCKDGAVNIDNAGGEIDIEQALDKIITEGLRMLGAMCGLWGICGAITSIGAALAIIDGIGPLSTDGIIRNATKINIKTKSVTSLYGGKFSFITV